MKNAWKKKGRRVLENVAKGMSHPYVRRVSRFAASMLETTSYVDVSNPASLVVGALSTVDAGIEAFDLPTPNKMDQWAETRDLEETYGHLPRLILTSGLTKKYQPKVVCSEDNVSLKELTFDFGRLYFVQSENSNNYYGDELDKVWGYFYTTKNFEFDKLFDEIWSLYPTGIYLSVKMGEEEHASARNLLLHHLSTSEMFYLGEEPAIGPFIEDLKAFKERKISRSYMLAGTPGTGKTSFAIQSSQAITKRILKIDPSVARQMGSGEFEFIVRNLSPEVLLFDDFDRAAGDAIHLLFLLENIKHQFPEVVIFATVNEFDDLDAALKRPGRFDRTIWFDLPEPADRATIACHYLEKGNVDYTEEAFQTLVDKTDGMSPAYIKELCIRIESQGWGHLDTVVAEFRRTLGKDDEDEEDEDDDED